MGQNLRKQTFLGNCLFSPYTNTSNNSYTNKREPKEMKVYWVFKNVETWIGEFYKNLKLKTFDTEESWPGLEYSYLGFK